MTNLNSYETINLQKIDLSRSSQALLSNKMSQGIEHYKPKLEPLSEKLSNFHRFNKFSEKRKKNPDEEDQENKF